MRVNSAATPVSPFGCRRPERQTSLILFIVTYGHPLLLVFLDQWRSDVLALGSADPDNLSIFCKINKLFIFKAHFGPIICYKYVQHFDKINSTFC